jgi:hypothetical protein
MLRGEQVLSAAQLLQALLAAWAYIDRVPCDPDIFEEQEQAWNKHVEARKEVEKWFTALGLD